MNGSLKLWGMICLCVFGFFFSLLTYANTDRLDLDTLVKGKDYPAAIERLGKQLRLLDSSHDVESWTVALLQGARIRALQAEGETAFDYLKASDWPQDRLARIILKLGVAGEIEYYLNQKSWSLVPRSGRNEGVAKSQYSEFSQLTTDLNNQYRSAFEVAKKNSITLSQVKVYITEGEFPSQVRGYLADFIANRWMMFLLDDLYWSQDQQKKLSHMNVESLLNLGGSAAFSESSNSHPLQQIKNISATLLEWHNNAGRKEAAFEVIRFYLELLSQYFSKADDIEALSQYLEECLNQLGSQYPWWTMGQYQLALFRQKMQHQSALLEAHDLAVQASIIHPGSIGAKRSKQLLSKLKYQEFSITGKRSSGLGHASLTVNYRNLYRLYFRAWRVKNPLPRSLEEGEKKVVVDELLKQPAEVEWVAELSNYSDLHHHEVQLIPELPDYGQWLLMVSPQAEFSDAFTKLQLLNVHLSHYVASVSYYGGEFRVCVYEGVQGRALPNITVELLQINDNSTEVLSEAKTNVHGIAKLPRDKDAKHYQVRLRHGVDSSVIEIPSLLPLRDEQRWASQPAKAVVLTNKAVYKAEDVIKWSLIVKSEILGGATDLKALPQQRGWIKLYDPDNRLIAEQQIKTDKTGLASGEFQMTGSGEIVVGTWRIESSWQGNKLIKVQQESLPEITLDELPNTLHADQLISITGAVSGETGVLTPTFVSWKLRRVSYSPNGDLHSFVEISQGTTEVINRKFNIEVALLVNDDLKQFKQYFELQLDYQQNDVDLITLTRPLNLTTDHEYLSVQAKKAFFEVGAEVDLTLSRTNSQWQGVSATSQWFLYRLNESNQEHNFPLGQKALWLLGALQDKGTIKHDADGSATLRLEGLAGGVYRLRLMDKGGNKPEKSLVTAELDFFVVQSGSNNRFGMGSVLLAQKAEARKGETLKLLAGSEVEEQWVRLNIFKRGKVIASQMLSPGVHLLEFPIVESHQGGLGFNLEWVEQNQIHNKDILVTVPWSSKKLQLEVTQKEAKGAELPWVLEASTADGSQLSAGSQVLIYYSEFSDGDPLSDSWVNLDALYEQSVPSMIRLDNNGTSYPYYFRGSRDLVSSMFTMLKHPEIRYSDKNNNEYLGKDSVFDLLPMMMVNTESAIGRVRLSESNSDQGLSSRSSQSMAQGSILDAQYMLKGELDAEGTFNLAIPTALRDKKVRANILVISPVMETGQLSVDLW